jgi:hypothetical protein
MKVAKWLLIFLRKIPTLRRNTRRDSKLREGCGMSDPTSRCRQKIVDEYGICVVCGMPTRLYSLQLYVTKSSLLELERGRGTISEPQYIEQKRKLEAIKDYCLKNDLWHPTMKDLSYPISN